MQYVLITLVIKMLLGTNCLQQEEVAAPGSDVTLSCLFPASVGLNITYLTVNWQRGDRVVVHSFYHGKDQLERQSAAFIGRTNLFVDRLQAGNASLRLIGVQQKDHGEYTCDVTDDQGITKRNPQLVVAAPYDEPEMAIQATCDRIVVTLNSSQGFPEPVFTWVGLAGSNVTTVAQDSRGRYEVQSEMSFWPNSTQTITVEMRLDVLKQSFTKSITLHPLAECCATPAAGKRERLLVLVPVIVMMLVVLLIWKQCRW